MNIGDVVLWRMVDHPVLDWAITKFDRCKYNHVTIILDNDEVMSAEATGIQIKTLDNIKSRSIPGINLVLRHPTVDPTALVNVCKTIVSENHPYGFLELGALAVIDPLRDTDGDGAEVINALTDVAKQMNDLVKRPKSLICSESAYHAFQRLGITLTVPTWRSAVENNPQICYSGWVTPYDISVTPDLKVVT